MEKDGIDLGWEKIKKNIKDAANEALGMRTAHKNNKENTIALYRSKTKMQRKETSLPEISSSENTRFICRIPENKKRNNDTCQKHKKTTLGDFLQKDGVRLLWSTKTNMEID